MQTEITDKTRVAMRIILVIQLMALIFHSCIVLQIIPYAITWGGKLHNLQEMYLFESISILINVFFVWVLLMHAGKAKAFFSMKVVCSILWAFMLLFVLNTIGNIFAKTTFEQCFTFVTLLISVLLAIILKNKK